MEAMDPRVVEAWVDLMETLFEDLYILGQEKVHVVAHCLESKAHDWSNMARDSRPIGAYSDMERVPRSAI